MRVDPYFVTNLSSSLSQSSAAEQQLTAELSSGLSISQLSDNPVAVAQSQLYSGSISRLDAYTKSATTEQGLLQVTDSTLGEVVSSLTSAISLATSAGNGTLNSANLAAIGTQVTAVRDQVLSLANTSYEGQYLFSGTQGTTEPFTLDTSTTPASVNYNGDANSTSVSTPTGQSITVSLPGSSIFTAPGSSVLDTLNQTIADIASGNTSAVTADASALSTALGTVDDQRSVLNSSLSQLNTTSTYATTQATQLLADQSALISADPSTVATSLEAAETQHQALLSVISSLGKTDLFSYLQ